MHIYIPALTIIFILLIASLNVVYDVEDNKKDAVFSKTIHLLADYDLNLELDASDKNKIHEVIPEKTIKERYNPYYLDTIGYASNESAFDNDRGAYITMAIKYSLQNPIHFLDYLFKSSAMTWDITRDNDWKGKPYYDITTDGARTSFFNHNHSIPTTPYENASLINFGTDEFNRLDFIVDSAKDNIILDTLFNSPALYMYLSFIIMAGIYLLTRTKEICLVYLPNMLNIVYSILINTNSGQPISASKFISILFIINDYNRNHPASEK